MTYYGMEPKTYKNIRVDQATHAALTKIRDELNEGKYWDKDSYGTVVKILVDEHNAAKPTVEKGPAVRCKHVGTKDRHPAMGAKDCSTCKGTKRNDCYVAPKV